jgi:hypothetical protein
MALRAYAFAGGLATIEPGFTTLLVDRGGFERSRRLARRVSRKRLRAPPNRARLAGSGVGVSDGTAKPVTSVAVSMFSRCPILKPARSDGIVVLKSLLKFKNMNSVMAMDARINIVAPVANSGVSYRRVVAMSGGDGPEAVKETLKSVSTMVMGRSSSKVPESDTVPSGNDADTLRSV